MDDDPTDGWDRKIRMLQNEIAGDLSSSGGKQTRSSKVKANRAFQEMLKNKSPSKNSPKKMSSSPWKVDNATEKGTPTKSPVKKKLIFGGSREVGKRNSRITNQRSPSKRFAKQDNNYIDPLELPTPDKKHAQTLGVALRNLLKLPKAHKWVCYEFFYSNLDQVTYIVYFVRFRVFDGNLINYETESKTNNIL